MYHFICSACLLQVLHKLSNVEEFVVLSFSEVRDNFLHVLISDRASTCSEIIIRFHQDLEMYGPLDVSCAAAGVLQVKVRVKIRVNTLLDNFCSIQLHSNHFFLLQVIPHNA